MFSKFGLGPIEIAPPTGGFPGQPLFSLENILRAYRNCRTRKRRTHNAMAFERRLEENDEDADPPAAELVLYRLLGPGDAPVGNGLRATRSRAGVELHY